jgi:hypothetical protein
MPRELRHLRQHRHANIARDADRCRSAPSERRLMTQARRR